MKNSIKTLMTQATWENNNQHHIYYGYLNRFTLSCERVSMDGVFPQLLTHEMHINHNKEEHFADDLLHVIGPHLSIGMIEALQKRLNKELEEHKKIAQIMQSDVTQDKI